MSYEMNFEMYVEDKKQRKGVLEVIRKALTEEGFDKFADDFIEDKKEKCMIRDNTSCSFSADNFDEAVSTIYKAIIKELPNVIFKGYSGYTYGTFEGGHCFEKKGNTLIVERIVYEGSGWCPDCCEEVVFVDDYDPTKNYVCPECGEVVPNEDLFSYFEKEEIIYEIIDGNLIKQ